MADKKKLTMKQNRESLSATLSGQEEYIKNHAKELTSRERGKLENSIMARKGTLAGISDSGRTAKYTGRGKKNGKKIVSKK